MKMIKVRLYMFQSVIFSNIVSGDLCLSMCEFGVFIN